jgi:hypothetical protein
MLVTVLHYHNHEKMLLSTQGQVSNTAYLLQLKVNLPLSPTTPVPLVWTGQWPSGNARMGVGSRRGFDPRVPHATSVKDFQRKLGAGDLRLKKHQFPWLGITECI